MKKLRELVQSTFFSSPSHLLVTCVFLFLYSQFIMRYGFGYMSVFDPDFSSFYFAAQAIFEQGQSPYNFQYLDSMYAGRVYPYLYPPFTLILFSPFLLFSYEQARVGMLILNHLFLFAFLIGFPKWFLKLTAKENSKELTLCFVYVLSFFPLIDLLRQGQLNLILAVLYILIWLGLKKERNLLVSVCLALVISLKVYFLLLLPALLLIRRYRVVIYTTFILICFSIFSYCLLAKGVWHDWIHLVLPSGGYLKTPHGLFPPSIIGNQSINGLMSRLFLYSNFALGRQIAYTLSSIVLIVTSALIWNVARRNKEQALDWTMLIVPLLMFLVAPLSWEHHLVYLLPSLVMLLVMLIQHPSVMRSYLISVPLFGSFIAVASPYHFLPHKFYGVAVIWIVVLWLSQDRRILLPGTDPNPRSDGESTVQKLEK